MSSPVAELDAILQSMLGLKPPGVTAGKIHTVTALCNANIQSETVLIQRIYTHFKKAPGTHKLGVLYVVDSVTRAWVEQAKKAGQSFGPSAPDGTFAAGVNRVTELLSSFLNDIISTAPEEHKERIIKLLVIWTRSQTFPEATLEAFKKKLEAPAPSAAKSTTPPGSPPSDFIPLNGNGNPPGAATTAPDTSRILRALADMAKTSTPATGMPGQASSGSVTNLQNAYPQTVASSVNPAPAVPPFAQAVGVSGAAGGTNPYAGMSSAPTYHAMPMQAAQMNMQANPVAPQGTSPEALQQQVQLLRMLQEQNVPQDQWATLLSVLMSTNAVAGANTNANANANANANNASSAPPQPGWGQNAYGARDDARDRDRSGYTNDQYITRSPPGRYRNHRSRSRSPGWDRRREPTPPRRRDSPTYGEYGRGGRGGSGGRGKGSDYRQRSPDRYRRSASPRRTEQTLPAPGPKHIEYDQSLGAGNIQVLSRTLFVGGVTSSEEHLRGIFAQFGVVQTCIVNVDKRHAFVKMISRNDAMAAKDGMERYKSAEMQLRTRWGVGFGPRDCSDYSTGVSVIPIEKLTDADRKWMLTADYGGTGGKPIESYMVVEEPDIEIGAGVSSKAISRRMATDKGGQQGPRSTRDGPSNQPLSQRYRQPERNDRDTNNSIGVAPAVPAFNFNFPGMPNGFSFPPGFVMPGSTPSQPPPPGAS